MALLSTRSGQIVATFISVTATIVLLTWWPAGRAVLASGRIVTVSASATDPNGYPLTYRWRSSDGQIVNANAATTTWTLPDGPGLHFAYVLVSNGRGGYTEQRVAVNTDDPSIGTPIQAYAPKTVLAPPAPVPTGLTYRRWSTGHDFLVYAQDDANHVRIPAVGFVKSDLKQQVLFRGMPGIDPNSAGLPDPFLTLYCGRTTNGPFFECDNVFATDSSAPTPWEAISEPHFRFSTPLPAGISTFVTKVVMADGNVCGTQNEFFAVEATSTIEVRDQANTLVGGPQRVNAYGFVEAEYPDALFNAPLKLVVRCENAQPLTIPFTPSGLDFGVDTQLTATIPVTARPAVSTMTATLGALNVGLFLGPGPTGLPSDNVPEFDKFLAYKGLDSRVSACLYYKAVGAVTGCDRSGNLIGAVRFDDWKRTVQMAPYIPQGGPTEYVATYINKADLNLTRNHHSVSYGPNQTAAYVCNHLGPKFDATQDDIDQAIDNAVNGKNLVACVAMDYTIAPGVNNNQPFIRFLIFGPSGELLSSVNLDGRREKFVPGTCVICHGGDQYTGRYQDISTAGTPANIAAHFLPYDNGNFLFSSKVGLREQDQEASLHNLNLNVLNANPTPAAQGLIAGWYANNSPFDHDYVPQSWKDAEASYPHAPEFYKKVIGTSCRGCHINMTEQFNFENFDTVINGRADIYRMYDTVGECSGTVNPLYRMHSMPNSAVTFNRFWTTPGLPELFVDFANDVGGAGSFVPLNLTCKPERP